MARRKISMTVYVTQEQFDRLKLLNERTRVPTAERIREGLDLMLAFHEEVVPGITLPLPPADESSSA